jgi:hypothetical protein
MLRLIAIIFFLSLSCFAYEIGSLFSFVRFELDRRSLFVRLNWECFGLNSDDDLVHDANAVFDRVICEVFNFYQTKNE